MIIIEHEKGALCNSAIHFYLEVQSRRIHNHVCVFSFKRINLMHSSVILISGTFAALCIWGMLRILD